MAGKKKFRLFDVILSVICVIFVAEAAAPVASIGNSQYFWWIFMIIAFLLPYGLITAELGTTFESDGGLYDWVRMGAGKKWGGRVAWYYWINFPLWMASLAVVFPEIISMITGGGNELIIFIGCLHPNIFVGGVTDICVENHFDVMDYLNDNFESYYEKLCEKFQ